MEGGLAIAKPDSAQTQFLLSTLLSFLFASTIFWLMAVRQAQRPFVHASLALIVMLALSFGLAAAMGIWLGGNFHAVLALVEWLTLVAALVVGTSLAQLWRGRSRPSATDA